MSDKKPFNPIEIPNIALNLALEVLEQPVHQLPPNPKPVGAGVYLLYYGGGFAPYERYTDSKLAKVPIYVGKADRKGMRKGFKFDPPQGHELNGRLRDHAKSIDLAENLELTDFSCRFLAIEDSFIGLAESILVSIFDPLWNRILDGFGNNPTGGPRANQAISKWDQLHPGRKRGMGAGRAEVGELAIQVSDYFKNSEDDCDHRLTLIRQRIEKYGLG